MRSLESFSSSDFPSICIQIVVLYNPTKGFLFLNFHFAFAMKFCLEYSSASRKEGNLNLSLIEDVNECENGKVENKGGS